MKRLCLLLVACLAFLVAFPGISLAQDEITVLSSDALVAFPLSITFTLKVKAPTEIADIDLKYRQDKQSLVPVSYRVDVDFTPGLEVEASWTWNMLETGGLPPGVEIEYWWLIEDVAGHRFEASPQRVRFEDLGYDWDRLVSEEVTLLWYQGAQSFAQELMQAAHEALGRLASDIGTSLERPARIYVYASFDDLRGALVFPYEWTGGVAFYDYGIISIGISPDNLAWGKRALAHELAHLVIHQAVFGPYGGLPTWLDEGLAAYAEGEPSPDRQEVLDEAIAEDGLISVRSLSSSFPTDPEQAALAYAQSCSLVEFLLDSYGRDKMLELLDVFKQGSGYDAALSQVYGFDMEGLDALWRASLGLEPSPPVSGQPSEALGCTLSLMAGERSEDTGLIGLGALLLLPALVFGLHRASRR